jgi:hypothetical protein
MVYEFAIEPDLVATWGDPTKYKFFMEKFGLGTPRIMSEFPKLKNWRRRVLQAASGKEGLELQRITAIVNSLSETLIKRNAADYDGTQSWVANAKKEHQIQPFYAILATAKCDNNFCVLTDNDIFGENCDRWNLRQEDVILRQALSMGQAVSALLSNCNEVIFVDPYFDPKRIEYRRPFEHFFQSLLHKRKEPPRRIEVHTSNKLGVSFFNEICREKMPGIILKGLKVIFRQWQERPGGEKLHNRYILTDIGGVDFGTGLDESDAGQTDDLTLLGKERYKIRWQQYASNNPAFDPVGELIEIVGIKKH